MSVKQDFIQKNKMNFSGFHDLMEFRVREILLVASLYDAFVLEEDGKLSERIFGEYLDMNLQFVPRIHNVSSTSEAFEQLDKKKFDLVIVMFRMKEMSPVEFSNKIKKKHPEIKVVMLTYEALNGEMANDITQNKTIDRIFYWSGSDKLLLTIIKHIEDFKNVSKDTAQGVQIILLIEDSPLIYSQLMPHIYTQLMEQTQYLISQGVNNLHKLLRMRARPKIMLATTYEEAVSIYNKYSENILGVISDVEFRKEGSLDKLAGFSVLDKIKKNNPYLPLLVYSDENENKHIANKKEYTFISKNSPDLASEIGKYIIDNYGFGDFVFKYPNGTEICRVKSVSEFEKVIKTLPKESLQYHARGNHFSRWFKARTEFLIAQYFISQGTEFKDSEVLRSRIISGISDYYLSIYKGKITEFDASKVDIEEAFIKLGRGSIGGKGRGIAFFNALLSNDKHLQQFNDVKICTPSTFVICSEVYEQFIEINNIRNVANITEDEITIDKTFLSAKLPQDIVISLAELIDKIDYPIAVRSSSILEDSQMLPFAGIYRTYVLPNNHNDKKRRLNDLLDATKLVYASVFHPSAKKYIKNAHLRLEEEKMAVLIQKAVGQKYNDIYYPTISGVAQSYNYYPVSQLEPEHGIISLALGFGRIIMDGEQTFRFCPAKPKKPPVYASASDQVKYSQNYFYALDLNDSQEDMLFRQNKLFMKLDLHRAENNDVLKHIASTYSYENDIIRDTMSISGARVITFSPILKYESFPLVKILQNIMQLCKDAFSSEVEVEFAVNIPDEEKKVEFYLLQIRPMVTSQEFFQIEIQSSEMDNMFVYSNHSTGNGIYDNLYDLIVVDIECFDINNTQKIADEIGVINNMLFQEHRKCILIGIGRIGTSDRWLGIPTKWAQISQAKVVVEVDIPSLQAEPSLGSHFHHNLISLKMGYMHIGLSNENESIDWDWLLSKKPLTQMRYIKHFRFEESLVVKIDGREGKGLIVKNSIL